MSNQVYVAIRVELLGDGTSLTAMIVLDTTPFYADTNIRNWSSLPFSAQLIQIRDTLGNPVPATASLTKSGKQIVITFSSAFTGRIVAVIGLGYNV
jgi:hypothetical protein